jgi:RNA polymerase sigma factor (sigma-70 family)
MDREQELQLVNGLRGGEPAAFDAVFDAFNRRLYNFLARLTNRRDIAEDLLEETWLRLVVHAPRLRPDTRLAQWLFTVARHLHVSHCRSRLLENTHGVGLLGLWPSGRSEPSPLVAAEANETERRVMQALALLPPRRRSSAESLKKLCDSAFAARERCSHGVSASASARPKGY